MSMTNIVWLCNIVFSDSSLKSTGGWLQPLAEGLEKTKNFHITNIAFGGETVIKQELSSGIVQWLIPRKYCYNFGVTASKKTCKTVADIINNIDPDLVHIWGTESVWGSIYAKGYIKYKTVLDIQGLLSVCTKYYDGNLSIIEKIKCIGLREMLLPNNSILINKIKFYYRGLFEKAYIKTFENISVQSEWVQNYIKLYNPDAKIYCTKIMLRDAFYKAQGWKFNSFKDNPVIFTFASAAIPYKGIHVLLKSIKILKLYYPNIRLNIAGDFEDKQRLKDGYKSYLKSLIIKLDVVENVRFLGSLDEMSLINNLECCNVCVIPSFVETYCLAFAESLLIGAPTIAAYSGAMPEQVEEGKEALMYEQTNYVSCAFKIKKLLENVELCICMSKNAKTRKLFDNDSQRVIDQQMFIYKEIINN